MEAPVVFIDTETTGLDPTRHEAWEVALITPDGTTKVWYIAPDLSEADPVALRVNRFYERRGSVYTWDDSLTSARQIAIATANRHLVGAVPEFDAKFLERLLRRHGLAPAWHYQTVDVEALAAGLLGLEPPFDTREIGSRLGVPETPPEERHTALGDARWAKAVYEAVYERAGRLEPSYREYAGPHEDCAVDGEHVHGIIKTGRGS